MDDESVAQSTQANCKFRRRRISPLAVIHWECVNWDRLDSAHFGWRVTRDCWPLPQLRVAYSSSGWGAGTLRR